MGDLDCESFDSAMNSLASLFKVTPNSLAELLMSIDATSVMHRFRESELHKAIFRELVDRLGTPDNPRHIYWFHVSRCKNSGTFRRDGILPLGEVISGVWDTMISAVSGTRHEYHLQEMRTENEISDFVYRMRTKDPFHHGPYAMLIADAAFVTPNHNYYRLPEIMEDICIAYQSRYGEDIEQFVLDYLVPTRVKFRTGAAGYSTERILPPVAYYLFCKLHGQEVGSYANFSFDGTGQAVPPKDIRAVQEMPRSSATDRRD
jgi:hypothetical protein